MPKKLLVKKNACNRTLITIRKFNNILAFMTIMNSTLPPSHAVDVDCLLVSLLVLHQQSHTHSYKLIMKDLQYERFFVVERARLEPRTSFTPTDVVRVFLGQKECADFIVSKLLDGNQDLAKILTGLRDFRSFFCRDWKSPVRAPLGVVFYISNRVAASPCSFVRKVTCHSKHT